MIQRRMSRAGVWTLAALASVPFMGSPVAAEDDAEAGALSPVLCQVS
jgi:hypothetical protein